MDVKTGAIATRAEVEAMPAERQKDFVPLPENMPMRVARKLQKMTPAAREQLIRSYNAALRRAVKDLKDKSERREKNKAARKARRANRK